MTEKELSPADAAEVERLVGEIQSHPPEVRAALNARLREAKRRELSSAAATPVVSAEISTDRLSLAEREQKLNSAYFGKEINVPALTPEQQATIERLAEFGFAAHYLPPEIIPEGAQLPGQKKQINSWVYQQVENRNLARESIKLPGGWIMAEKIAKPEYADGKQMYANDLLGDVIAKLREQGVLQSHKPNQSRFNISFRELADPKVKQAFADFLGVRPEQLRLETMAEYNTLGNMHYPERGETNTGEWLADETKCGGCLVGGGRADGGLSDVRWYYSDDRRGGFGFRLLVDLSK